MKQTIWARQALLPDGWARDVLLEIDAAGRIDSVQPGAVAEGQQVGCLLPAPVNLHSHAFQRAMAGLTERRGEGTKDSFWTWRQWMFKFLDQLNPEDVESITAWVQMNMLESGFGSVAEFHYLHHQTNGNPYDSISEMSQRIMAAAAQSGIGLTLLPVMYEVGGCDGRPLVSGQRRFQNDFHRFTELFQSVQAAIGYLPADGQLGIAPHSLRAVTRGSLVQLPGLCAGPVHMHLAEQLAEVQEVEAHFGARPVEWLLEHLPIDQRWCLIHCTQTESHEILALAESKAVVGLCPITESSLGDGIFDARRFLDSKGRFGIGSDSNVRISLTEELRTLEYSQRLRDHQRAILSKSNRSTGRVLLETAVRGGARAAGRQSGRLEPGNWADLLAIDDTCPELEGRSGDVILDTWIFVAGDGLVREVWSAGRHVVHDGRHVAAETITSRYRATLKRLKDHG